MQEERQAPTLRLVMWLRIQLWQCIAQLRLSWHDSLAPEVRHLGDLVCEHLLDGLGLKDLGPGGRMRTVVEEHRDDLAVFCGASEAASAAGMEGAFSFFLTQGQEGPAVEMAVGVDRKLTVCGAG